MAIPRFLESRRPHNYLLPTVVLVLALSLTLIVFNPFASNLLFTFSSGSQNKPQQHGPQTIFKPSPDSLSAASQDRDKPGSFPFVFAEDHDLESLAAPADAVWDGAVSTAKGGFLWVRHNETFERAWGVSMFHAVHCLGMLRGSLKQRFGLAKGSHGMGSGGGHGHGHGHGGGEVDLEEERMHVEHCLGYITRALLCAGDDTLEPPFGEYDDAGNLVYTAVDGEGHEHQCKDSSLAWQTVLRSEDRAVEPFDWSKGDTVSSVFGRQ